MGNLVAQSIPSPGYWGINTNNSPSDLDPRFATIAENCVVDREGRLTSRKHYDLLTTNKGTLATGALIKYIYEHRRKDNAIDYLSAGDFKIFKGVETLTAITPSLTPAITANDWRFASLNGYVLGAQTGHEFFALNETAGAYTKTALTGFPAVKPNDVEVAYGRVWVCDDTTNDYTVWWSDTLAPLAWSGGAAGSLNLQTAFVNKKDKVVAVRAFNGLLCIFCRESILIYDGAQTTPGSNLTLVEVINNVGCVSRNTIVQVFNDLWFMSENGMQSLGRVIQEKSLPIEQKTHLVAIEFGRQNGVENATNMSATVYPAEHLVLVRNQQHETVWCFNLQHGPSPELRAITMWTGNLQRGGMCYDTANERLLVGGVNGIYLYDGYGSSGDSYRMKFYSGWMSFGDGGGLKHLKKINYTVEGGSGQSANVYWSFDYMWPPKVVTSTIGTAFTGAEYGVGEYGIGEYSLGTVIGRMQTNPGQSGRMIQIGLETDIVGQKLAILKADIYINKGKLT